MLTKKSLAVKLLVPIHRLGGELRQPIGGETEETFLNRYQVLAGFTWKVVQPTGSGHQLAHKRGVADRLGCTGGLAIQMRNAATTK